MSQNKKICIMTMCIITILMTLLLVPEHVINEIYGKSFIIQGESSSQWTDENIDEAVMTASGDINNLYSLSACLIDADTGRVLFEKDGFTRRANASTTKIMTCILALEYGNPDDTVTVSKYAASMPDVQLNIKEGENYRLGDLLYSLMLESHNDVAVAIAEHIGGDVKTFAAMMNEKAKELGCYDTYFITPNGLDATETIDGREVFHGTTAADLARIMSYCIKNEDFLKITRTSSYTFSSVGTSGTSRTFTVSNKNAFLNMMEGALSGKTGFTGEAGYCYVGALKRDDKTFVVALLGCGWPNNKSYKWSDTKALMNYGLSNYSRRDLFEYDMEIGQVTVTGAKTKNEDRENIIDKIKLDLFIEEEPINMLVKEDDTVEIKINVERELTAPVADRQIVGSVEYYLNGEIIKSYPVYVNGAAEEIDYKWSFQNIVKKFLMIE